MYTGGLERCAPQHFLNTTILLGGPGKVVQVDESLFRHKPKVKLNVIIILHF